MLIADLGNCLAWFFFLLLLLLFFSFSVFLGVNSCATIRTGESIHKWNFWPAFNTLCFPSRSVLCWEKLVGAVCWVRGDTDTAVLGLLFINLLNAVPLQALLNKRYAAHTEMQRRCFYSIRSYYCVTRCPSFSYKSLKPLRNRVVLALIRSITALQESI